MEEKLIARLSDLGYEYDEATDAGLLMFCTDAVGNDIKNRINQTVVPEGLEHIYVDMVCGEFLKTKKAFGQLDTYNFEQAVQSIKEGDTQVTFTSGMSQEQQFDSLIAALVSRHDEDFNRYRRFVW